MRALVTGGAGFIGSNVVSLLLERGYEVAVLEDLSSGHVDNLAQEARFHEAEVRNAAAVNAAAAGCSAIFHLTASVGSKRSIDDPRRDAEVNLFGMVSVLEATRGNGIHKVVFSSSAGIFGELKTLPSTRTTLEIRTLPTGSASLPQRSSRWSTTSSTACTACVCATSTSTGPTNATTPMAT